MNTCNCTKCQAAARANELHIYFSALTNQGKEIPGCLLAEMKWCAYLILGVHA